MFKLVVFFALVAASFAKPHGAEVAVPLIAAPVSYISASPVLTQTYLAPAAVSSTYREDIISKPVSIVAEEKPISEPVVVEAKTAVSEPVTVATTTEAVEVKAVEAEALEVETVEAKAVEVPAGVSSTYREDIISKPAVVAYSVPLVQKTVAYAAPLAYHAVPAYQAW